MTSEEQKQERFLAVLQQLDRDTTTPEEVAEALLAVFNYINERANQTHTFVETSLQGVSELRSEVLGDVNRKNQNLFDKVRGLINAATAGFVGEERKMQKLVDALYEWKRSQEISSLPSDVATALDIGDQNTAAIRKVRIALKNLKREPGPRGPRGRAPAHEWEDTKLRFQNPDQSWGDWVDLRGPAGGGMFAGMFGGGPSGESFFGITTNGTSGPATLSDGGILNIPQYVNAGGGTTQSTIDPSEAADDSRLTFSFATKPFLIVVNNRSYRENHGWTWAAGVATLSATDPGPVGTGGEIYGIIQT